MDPDEKSELLFLERVLRYQENSLSPEELRELNEELRNDPALREEFARICGMSRWVIEAAATPSEKQSADGRRRILPFSLAGSWVEHTGIAALLMLCLGLAGLLWVERADDRWRGGVARLDSVSEDAVFAESHEMATEAGSLLGKGWVRLDEGSVRLVFRSGAEVTLEAPAALGVATPMRSYLEFGKVRVHAPESARDFVVATEGVEVVDLGTVFDLEVDLESGISRVEVEEGLVDLHLGSRGSERQIQPLEAGWQAQVDGAGEIVRLESPGSRVGTDEGERESSLLAHWRLDEIRPDGALEDSSGSGLVGRFRGESAAGQVRPGKTGEALAFGSEGYLDLSAHLETFADLESFTLSAWIRDPAERVGILFSLSDGTAKNRVQFNLNSKFLVYLWQDQTSHWDSIAGRVEGWTPGQWYHVAVSVGPSGVRLYRDGELLTNGSVGIQIGTRFQSPAEVVAPSEAFIGHIKQGTARSSLRPQWFGGVMDDIQIYATPLSHAAIRTLYDNPGEPWSPSSREALADAVR